MYYLGKTSKARLATCCPELQEIIKLAIKHPKCPCDFGIICGFRNEKEQTKAYVEEKSNAQWGESDHNFRKGDIPWSLAVDIGPYIDNDYMWDQKSKLHNILADHIFYITSQLGYHIQWGGTYKIGPNKTPDKFHYSIKFK